MAPGLRFERSFDPTEIPTAEDGEEQKNVEEAEDVGAACGGASRTEVIEQDGAEDEEPALCSRKPKRTSNTPQARTTDQRGSLPEDSTSPVVAETRMRNARRSNQARREFDQGTVRWNQVYDGSDGGDHALALRTGRPRRGSRSVYANRLAHAMVRLAVRFVTFLEAETRRSRAPAKMAETELP